eukprot:9133055-Alexandrium_andersonii.AAC.1
MSSSPNCSLRQSPPSARPAASSPVRASVCVKVSPEGTREAKASRAPVGETSTQAKALGETLLSGKRPEISAKPKVRRPQPGEEEKLTLQKAVIASIPHPSSIPP